MMICPECGTQNRDEARFCKACGSPLVKDAVVGNVNGKPRRSKKPIIIGIVAVVAVVFVGIALAMLFRNRTSDATPTMSAMALYSDCSPIVAGVDGTAHLRLRVPMGSGDVTIHDGEGNEVAFFREIDLENGGDGLLRAEFDVSIPARGVGIQTYGISTSGNSGSGNANSTKKNAGQVRIPVIPESVDPDPVSAQGAWVLADACDWVDANCAPSMSRTKAAAALVEYLEDDERAKSARQYGSTVLFGVGEGENSALYCICLDAIEEGMLGSGDTHTFATDGPVIRQFNSSGEQKTVSSGTGILAGNTITSSGVLLLEPTPTLMNNGYSRQVKQACDAYASAVGGALEVKTGDEVLAAMLGGEICDKGMVALRAHGITPSKSGTTFLQARSTHKSSEDDWPKIQADLADFLHKTADSCSLNMGEICFGLPGFPDTWRCAVTARATRKDAEWEVGVSITTNLIEERYANMDLENSIILLSSCGGLPSDDFGQWAIAHGAQYVLGYGGAVSEQDDAQVVSALMYGLATDSNEPWRGMNVNEALGGVPRDTEQSLRDSMVSHGNKHMFANGTGTLAGNVVGKDGSPVANAEVEVWRYFDLTFRLGGTASADENGSFCFEGLPCGRYVLVVHAEGVLSTATIVLDEKRVDGGAIAMNVATTDDEDSTADEPVMSTDKLGLGVSNGEVSADSEWYYLGIGSNHQENGEPSKPKIVRVNKEDTLRYEVLWEGEFLANITEVRLQGDRAFAYVCPWSDQGGATVNSQIVSVRTDGFDARTIAEFGSPSYSSQAFLISGEKIFYGFGFGDNWEAYSANLDGSSEMKLCSGTTPQGNATMVKMLAVVDGVLYFSVPSTGSDSGFQGVYDVRIDGSEEHHEVMRLGGQSIPAIIGNRIYAVDVDGLVSYSLEGKDRNVEATFADAGVDSRLYNMSPRYALILGNQKSWIVNMSTKDVRAIEYTGEDMSVNLIADEFVVVFLGQAFQRRGLDFSTGDMLWPVGETTATEVANDAAVVEEEQTGNVLAGYVHVHDEYMISSEEYVKVSSIVLDEPVPYTYSYKGDEYDEVAHDVALEVTREGEQGQWTQYDGKHITISYETLGGVYHDAIYYNVDALAFTGCELLSVDD